MNGEHRRPQRCSSRGEGKREKDGGQDDASKEVKEAVKGAREKAKEQMEREREKARLKRAERDSATKEREQQRKDFREQKREEDAMAIAQSVDDSARRAARESKGDSLKISAQTEAEQQAEAAQAQAAAVAAAAQGIERKRRKPQATPPPAVEEGQIRKLFELLDGKSKGEVSQRDVLVALKKHHPIRQLFGLVGSGEAAALQQRVEKIQEAFESGSGLGEVAPLFNSLKEASGNNGSFDFSALLSACQRQLQCNVLAAVESLPREHAQIEAFTPTKKWSVVPQGAACPAGLEYRMDMETGQTLARLPNKKS